MDKSDLYAKHLAEFPAPGGGGAHTAIFKAGCLGCEAGLDAEQVKEDVHECMPAGGRAVPFREIDEGVEAGFATVRGERPPPRQVTAVRRVSRNKLDEIIESGHGATEADIRNRSPIPIDWKETDSWLILHFLYELDELLFVGDDGRAGRIGETIRPVEQWCARFRQTGHAVPYPKVIVNPVSGKPAPKKSGEGLTLRGDANIAVHRFAVAEFDSISIEDQLAFWMAVPHLPVAAIIHSGKKSLHAWIRVDCLDSNEWETEISGKLFPGYLQPLGLDPACKNPSRLSRMPGHRRADTGIVQRCLYLAPSGKAVGA